MLLLLGSLPSSLGRLPKYKPIQRTCLVDEPSEHLRNTHQWLQQSEPLENNLWNSSDVQQRQARQIIDRRSHAPNDRRQTFAPVYAIDTYIHIVADNSTADPSSPNYVTDAMISNQFEYLANAYVNHSIGFRLLGVDRSINDTWASNGDDVGMKSALRRGTYSTLNIYYQSQLQAGPNTPGIPVGSTLLGFCTLPVAGVTAATPPDAYVIDGCNLLSGTMPSGNMAGYNLGGTTAHEVGHWNGMLHTFNDNTCDPDNFGDYVADTPQEMTSTSTFSALLTSCPTDTFFGPCFLFFIVIFSPVSPLLALYG